MIRTLKLATRKSPLALAQTEMVAALLREKLGVETQSLRIVTTGDKQTEWSLEKRGGKGLFTKELEQALLRGEADVAVHSAKDLPGDMPAGLALAGFLPRADVRDVLVRRCDVQSPALIATGSPRRRLQLQRRLPSCTFTEIRGNVDTRLRKIAADRVADATMLAAAGLARLGIPSWDGLVFEALPVEEMVPAVGQAAIAVQCRNEDAAWIGSILDERTARAVTLERAFLAAMGGGCHTAFAVHVCGTRLHLFHEQCGRRQHALAESDFQVPTLAAARILAAEGLLPGSGETAPGFPESLQ